ncbi:MAG TPA: MG2 domain-containing protein, partial [Burkholderiaceae bacterium]|nr:MG2 domain-containing protein [Burkholderiaceae bacterium]
MARFATLVLLWLVGVAPSWAARVAQVSPQGRVSVAESVKITFDSPVIHFGDGQAHAPATVKCDDPALKGSGRWLDAERWTYVFQSRPGPGVTCHVEIDPAFRALDGKPVEGATHFQFDTGAPTIRTVRPYGSSQIDEEQMFVLEFTGAVNKDSLLAHASCLAEGIGEAIPVRLITGTERENVLKAAVYDKENRGPGSLVLQCKRRLPANASVQLRVGPGVASPSGIASTQPAIFKYKVRPPFTVSFSCQRENAHAPCTPVLPISLSFSAPIPADQAAKIRLKTGKGERSPDKGDYGYRNSVEVVRFKGPFPPDADVTLVLPPDLKDDSGRPLSNADQFPLTTHMASFPPLVKFAKPTFGVIERFANVPSGGSEADYPPSVPLTVRNVEADLRTRDLLVSSGEIKDYVVRDDADVLHWYERLIKLNEAYLTQRQIDEVMHDRPVPENKKRGEAVIDTRGVSVLNGQSGGRQLKLPAPPKSGTRPFEVIGVPVPRLGFHVLEVESPRLGQSLLGEDKPMYVRSSALVTNLGVHIKQGRDDLLAWVTTLDQGKVVPGAAITVLSCKGTVLYKGKTDARGIWHKRGVDDIPQCDSGFNGIYVSARITKDNPVAQGKADFAFALSTWNDGIEPWRFNVPTDNSPYRTTLVDTVYDRPLFHVGETVSMKHFLRVETRDGLAVPTDSDPGPDRIVISLEGSDQRYTQHLDWKATPTGGLSAVSQFVIPKSAKVGTYSVTYQDANGTWFGSSSFRVAAFKLPVYQGTLEVSDKAGSHTLIAPTSVHADVQMSFVSGGPAGKLPVTLSGVVQENWLNFDGYDDYSFNVPLSTNPDLDSDYSGADPADTATHDRQALFLDKKPVTLDAHGGARIVLDSLPKVTRPQNWLFEASYPDPNGEIQTLSHTVAVWPAAVVVGLRTGSWVQKGKATPISVVALSPAGVPQAGVPVSVDARQKTTYSTRRRMVGGFYSYDNHVVVKSMGTVCQGKTDSHGKLECSITLTHSGSIQLLAHAKDAQGRQASAQNTLWVIGGDDLWFGGSNDDRMDVIPEKKIYKPGETASFQVRMPFHEATALVAIEREGVLSARVVHLEGDNPTVKIPVQAKWGPNVYVSVLALRGRLREVPWYSFFSWGWRHPADWYDAYNNENKEFKAPTAFVDLSKPSFRFGLTQIKVSDQRDALNVKVTADKPVYQVRGKANVTIHVTKPDGTPAANGQVAFAAVDEALLQLAPNNSWDLLGAMRQSRSYGVRTATAEMQVVGRRHYGRKAVPAGGGGGKSPTRELLNTLLLWKPMVQLDANGEAHLAVPLNDSITRFRLVAIADYGQERFGTGSTDIRVTQDLQAISGLPPLVREGDAYQAMVTVRNATTRDMKVDVGLGYSGKGVPGETLPSKVVDVAAGTAQGVTWRVKMPEADLPDDQTRLDWRIQAREQGTGHAADDLVVHQQLIPSVPVAVTQAALIGVDAASRPLELPVQAPDKALVGTNGRPRGGLTVTMRSSLAGGLPGVRHWLAVYPFSCLEQRTSKAIGMRDPAQWRDLISRLPNYLDNDGLASYFPGATHGSEVLTAYVLEASDEASALGMPFTLPDADKRKMLDGLRAYAQGRIVRHHWAPQKDLDVRKLLVIEALSHDREATVRMLDSIQITPNRWPTSAVINWLSLLQRMPDIPNRTAQLAKARQIILGRMLSRGQSLVFPDDDLNNWWWLMDNRAVNSARLLLTVA